MKVSSLVKKGSDEEVALYCGKCGIVYRLVDREGAEKCCKPNICEDCNTPIVDKDRRFWKICRKCEDARYEKKERDAFDKAEKVKLSDYKGEYLHRIGFSGEGYIPTGDIDDQWEEEGMPEYAWACERMGFHRLDADAILENELSDYAEDSIEQLDVTGLQKVIDEWLKKQDFVNYRPINKAVLLSELKAEREKVTEKEEGAK